MTSANVTEFRIFRNGKQVGSHSQHCMCKTHWEELLVFQPLGEHTILPWGLDEEEEIWEGEEISLLTFLSKIKSMKDKL